MAITRALGIAVLVGTCGLVGACGSSSHGTTSATPGKSSAAAGQSSSATPSAVPPSAIATPSAAASAASSLTTKAQAKAFADSVNLRPGDLPGFTVSPPDKNTAADDKTAADLSSCVGGTPPSEALVDVNSDNFDRGQDLDTVEFSSDVTVFPSVADVQRDLRALTSAKGLVCLKVALGGLLAGGSGQPGVTTGAPVLTKLPLTVPGSQGAFKIRVAISITGPGVQAEAVIDQLAFAHGQTELQVSDYSLGTPPDATTEQNLADLVAKRANGDTAATTTS
jgi:hypothetical protein